MPSYSHSLPDHLQRYLSDINHAIEICRAYIAMALPPTNPDIHAHVCALMSAGAMFAGGSYVSTGIEVGV